MPKKSKISDALLPRASGRYKVEIRSPTSFDVALVPSPKKRLSRKAYLSAEDNIRRFIDKLIRSADKRSLILEWAQDTENRAARGADRHPREMNLADAREMFRQLLLRQQSAPNVLVRLGARRPRSLVDIWEADARSVDEGNEQAARAKQEEQWLDKWLQVEGKTLTHKQQILLEALKTSRRRLASRVEEFNHSPTKDNEKDLADWRKVYDKAVRAAIRGKLNHPHCIEWIIWRRSLGDRQGLHTLYRTHPLLERRVLPPIEIEQEEMTLLKEICHLRSRNEKLSLRSLHRTLVERGIYKKSWAAFHRWLKNTFRSAIIERDSL